MAIPQHPTLFGVDVSKAELVIATQDGAVQALANDLRAIDRWLATLAGPCWFALEATSTYHQALAQAAYQQGHRVYLLDGYRLARYRDSIGGRAKTDQHDALLLVRYLAREHDELRPWTPPPAAYTRLQTLLRRRATLVQARVQIQQSLQGLPTLRTALKTLLRQLTRLDTLIQKQLREALAEAGWRDHARRCQAIEGIGPLTATALTTVFHRGHFRSSDAFIAFLGLDVRVRDSGQARGRRKLTKQGDPELRRLLYLAAMTARRNPAWAGFYQRYLDRGLKSTQALTILARKLARIAFAILKNGADYVPRKPCLAT